MDQMLAQQLGQETQLPSLEMSLGIVRDRRQLLDDGYSCVYTNTIAWRNATTPLPMEHNPRAVFERLFGDSETTDARRPAGAHAQGPQHPRLGHREGRAISQRGLGADATAPSWRSTWTRCATSSGASSRGSTRAQELPLDRSAGRRSGVVRGARRA